MANNIPNQGNISEQIESTVKQHNDVLKDAMNIVLGNVKAIQTVSSKIDLKEIKNAQKTLPAVFSTVKDYIKELFEIIKFLNNPEGFEISPELMKTVFGMDAELEDIFTKANEKDAESYKKQINNTKKQSFPQQIIAFSNVISQIMSAVSKLGEELVNPIGIVMFETNITIFKNTLVKIMELINECLLSLDIDKTSKYMELLVGEPEVCTEIIENLHEADKNGYTTDMEHTNKTTKAGKKGFLDVVLGFFNIINLLKTLPFINPVSVWVKFKIVNLCFNLIQKELVNIANSIKTNKDLFNPTDIEKTFDGILKLTASINIMFRKISEIGTVKNLISIYIAKKVITLLFGKDKNLGGIIGDLVTKLNKISIDDDVQKRITKLENTIKSITNIAKSLAILSLLAVPILLSIISIFMLKIFIEVFVRLFNKDLVEKLNNSQLGILELSKTILILSTSILLLALTGVLVTESWTSFAMVGAFVGLVLVFFFVLGFGMQLLKDKFKVHDNIIYLGATIALLSVSVILLAFAGQIITDEWENIWKVGTFLLITIGAFFLLSIMGEQIEKGSKEFLKMALTIVVLSASVIILTFVAKLISASWEQIGMLATVVFALIGALWLIGTLSEQINKGSYTLILLSVTLILFGIAITILSKSLENLSWENFGKMCAIIGAMIAFAVGLGIPAVAALALLGIVVLTALATTTIMFAVAIKIICDSIKTIKELNLDPEKDSNILSLPIETLKNAIEKIAEIDVLDILEASLKIGSLCSVSSSIADIAEVVQSFAQLKIPTGFDKNGKPIGYRLMTEKEFTSAADNIQKILTCLLKTVADPELSEQLDNLSKNAIKNVGRILDNTKGVTNLIDAIEKSVKINDTQITTGCENIKTLIGCYVKLMSDLFTGTFDEEAISGFNLSKSFSKYISKPLIDEDILGDIGDAAEELLQAIEPFDEIFKKLSELSKSKIDEKTLVSGINTVITVTEKLFNDNGLKTPKNYKNTFKYIENLAETVEDFADIKSVDLEKNTNSFVKIIDKANSIDINKIKSVRDLFEEMTAFSKSINGNFEKLADVLSEKLVDVLAKLNDSFNELSKIKPNNTSVNNTNSQISNNTNKQQEELQKSIISEQKQNIKSITDSLEQILVVLKEVKDNTETY